MNTRETLERAAADLQAFADHLDAKGVEPTADDQNQLLVKAGAVRDAKKAYDASKATSDLLTDTTTFLKSLTDAPASAVKSLADVVERTDDGRIGNPHGKTLGELFTESMEYREGFKGRYARGPEMVIPSSTKGISSPTWSSGIGAKALITGASATSAGAAVRNDMYANITDLAPLRERTVADLVTKGTTDSDAVEYVTVTARTNNAGPVPEATTAATPGLNGVAVGAYTAAHGVKPESDMTLAVTTTTVKTLAHWIPITKRAASDAGQVRTLVDAFLREGLEEELEDQMLTGSGAGENFTGILNSGISTVGSAGTDIDAIVDAIRTVRVTGRRRPTALVIHPNDWYSTGFLTAKDLEGRYLVGDPRASVEQLNTLWGLQVVVSEGITENTALVGDFRFAVLWEREGITVTMTDSHNDFFTRNLLVILAEMRAAFGVLDPQAFCSVTAV